ncbi:MAG: acetyl-CoA C-acetyltransferase, partial [Haloarculaceae archaeon]
MSDVRIAGVGMTPFGESSERTARDMFSEAAQKAFEDADIDADTVDELFYGNFMGELAEQQGHTGPLSGDAAGITAPTTRIESACASSGVAVRHGVNRLRAGDVDVVLVGGAERMTNLSTADGTAGLAAAADALWEIKQGVTFPGAYSLMANRYFHEHGGDREDLAHIAVKNHRNAVENDLAQFQRE